MAPIDLSDAVDWLLEPENPSVRYWTLLDIEGKPVSDREVLNARHALMASTLVKTILGAQNPGGWWESEGDVYLPKYTATTHSLMILAELGAERIPAIVRGVEQVYRFQRDSGHFLTELPRTEKGRASSIRDGCCFDGNILRYLVLFDYLDDPRTRSVIDFLVGDHDAEAAGWRCRSYPIKREGVFPKNCYMGATKALRGFATIPQEKRSREVRTVIDSEVESILENGVYRYLRNTDGSRKDKAGWKKFGFPLFYQSDALEVLDTLASLGVRDERLRPAIDLVLSARRPDGRWLLENTFNGKMWADIDAKGAPSKWVTLRATRALKRLGY